MDKESIESEIEKINDRLDTQEKYCSLLTKKIEKNDIDKQLATISHLLSKAERLSAHCEQNMNRLNNMMNEMKGLIAMVRPSAKRNAWYGEEIKVESKVESEVDLPELALEYGTKSIDHLKRK